MLSLVNPFLTLYAANKRIVTISIIVLLTLFVLAALMVPNMIALAGPATSDAAYCGC